MPADERLAQAARRHPISPSRRRWLGGAVGSGAVAMLPLAARAAGGASVAVVGAGLAGLQAAAALALAGARPTVYEAGDRVGGRVWSLRGLFPGQVAERGGELIDVDHGLTLLLARVHRLSLERYLGPAQTGETFFVFGGQRLTEAQVLAEAAAFVPAMQFDLQRISRAPSAFFSNASDRRLDAMSIAEYLSARGASPLLRSVIATAFTAQFGREIDRQSALVLLFAVVSSSLQDGFSEEHLHIVEGNDALPARMAAALPQPVRFGHRLLRVSRLADGQVRLAFATAGGTVESTHAAAVLAVPAMLLREIEFAAGAELGAGHRFAIERWDTGTSSKQMIGFRGRPWLERNGGNGNAFADLANLQVTWESNPTAARNYERGLLTDYAGGARGARLDRAQAQAEAEAFLLDFERVFPGSAALALRTPAGAVVNDISNWSRAPLFKGAYTNNAPGYFTTLEGRFARPAGNIVFAGEHTDSFYAYQGYMEGALRSGLRAAAQVLLR